MLFRSYFDDMERSVASLLTRDIQTLERLIGGSCRLKAEVIVRDPEEKSDLRFALNAGHTIGHALEAATGYGRWTHGEAVALGLVAEARLAERRGLAKRATVERQERVLGALGLPTRITDVSADAVIAAIGRDKKSRDGRVPFVLAPEIGRFQLVRDITPDEIRSAMAAA